VNLETDQMIDSVQIPNTTEITAAKTEYVLETAISV
jgi:hypothetical protein